MTKHLFFSQISVNPKKKKEKKGKHKKKLSHASNHYTCHTTDVITCDSDANQVALLIQPNPPYIFRFYFFIP